MPADLSPGIAQLKELLLIMASHAEAALNRALKALRKRDDDLARETREADDVIDRLQMEIDALTLRLLEARPELFSVRLLTVAMKIAQDLERVGDEATTISRRCLLLSTEPELRQTALVPELGRCSLAMLKDALDAFVYGDPAKARAVVARDSEADRMHKSLQADLVQLMIRSQENISRALNLMVISKSLERVADHAASIAEMVVYLYEGKDIRHGGG